MNVFNRTLGLVILVSLAIGMSSAAVLSSFGVITGTANVEGPTFYVADNQKLLVNEPPEGDEQFTWKKVGPDFSREFFVSKNLGNEEWYPLEVTFYANTKLVEDSGEGFGNLDVELKSDGSQGTETVCSTEIRVENQSNYKVVNNSCSGVVNGSVEDFTYLISGTKDKAFHIKGEGQTRVEVDVDEN